jgi:hemerythrin-like domain-containing protein
MNMRPTDILRAEHRVIEQVLDCLAVVAARARSSHSLDNESAADLLEVLATFADKCHHGKEEDLLFPALERAGMNPGQGPTAAMRMEHVQGRGHLALMRESLGDESAKAALSFAEAADAYVALLRQHIQKEDHCLFAMADSLLSAAVQKDLVHQFETVESQKMGHGTHQRMLDLASSTASRLNVPFRVAEGVTSCCCRTN